MSQLPWYAWLNLVGLLILWGFFWIGHKMEASGSLERVFNYLTLMVATFFVIYGGMNALAADAGSVLQGLAVFLMVATAWQILGGVWKIWFDDQTEVDELKVTPDQISSSEPVAGALDEDGVLDLDAGTMYSTENQEKINNAIKGVFRSGAPLNERLTDLGTLLSVGEDEEDDKEEEPGVLVDLFSIALVAAILVPPCVTAAHVF